VREKYCWPVADKPSEGDYFISRGRHATWAPDLHATNHRRAISTAAAYSRPFYLRTNQPLTTSQQ
jgi:hypothetical protein